MLLLSHLPDTDQSSSMYQEAHLIAQRAHNLPKPDQPPLEDYTARHKMYHSMDNIPDINHHLGQREVNPLSSQERIPAEQLVNVGEQSLPSTVIYDPVYLIEANISSTTVRIDESAGWR